MSCYWTINVHQRAKRTNYRLAATVTGDFHAGSCQEDREHARQRGGRGRKTEKEEGVAVGRAHREVGKGVHSIKRCTKKQQQ